MSELDVEGRHLRSRLADKLFGRKDPARIGRFVVIDALGQGGMGSVYLAYDPQLDRKVAVKVLSWVSTDAQKWMLREATTLARLNHPNVVTIHEVGEDHGEPFVAMEYVDGGTLRQWCLEHPEPSAMRTQEVLEFARQAIAGLHAAHALGVVHRDLKPANMLLGADGRLRLADFGLARLPSLPQRGEGTNPDALTSLTTSTIGGTIAGTPAYMAPEQFEGKSDERSDQFAFCVTFFEALHGTRPFAGDSVFGMLEAIESGEIAEVPDIEAPPYVRRVLERGLSARADDRFADISALGRALRAGERRRRRSVLAKRSVGGVVLVGAMGAGIYAYQRHALNQKVEACRAEGDAIDEVWNEGSREALRAGLLATGLGNAEDTASRAMPWIDAQAEVWREQATAACMNESVHEVWGAVKLGKAQWCLEDRRLELVSTVRELAKADEMVARGVMEAVTSFSPVETCMDEISLAGMAAPPGPERWPQLAELRQKLSRGQLLESMGKYEEGLAIVGAARQEAQSMAWPPLSAAIAELEAILRSSSGAYEEAETIGIAAYMEAARASSWDVAFDAANGLVSTVGIRQARFDDGKLWGEHARVALTYAGDPLGLREAGLAGNLGSIQQRSGNLDEALSLQQRALAVREEALGPKHPKVATSLGELGNVLDRKGELERAMVMYRRALAIREEALGPKHPHVASSLNNLAVEHARLGRLEEAKALFFRSMTIHEASLGAEHPEMVKSLTNLGSLHNMLGEHDEAKRLYRRALTIAERSLGPEHPSLAGILGNLGAVLRSLEEIEEARIVLERALAIQEQALGSGHLNVVYNLNELGFLSFDLGDLSSALAYFERALAIASAEEGEGAKARLAESRHGMAQVLSRLPEGEGRDLERARAYAIQARDAFATIDEADEKNLVEIDALLLRIGPPN